MQEGNTGGVGEQNIGFALDGDGVLLARVVEVEVVAHEEEG